MNTEELIYTFIKQSEAGNLKTANYPKDWEGLKLKVSFGMGAPARVPWIAFTAPEITVSNGYYPVYLYYKELKTLILSYGLSETNEYRESWPAELTSSTETIKSFLGKEVPRYGDSFVFKAYKVEDSEPLVGAPGEKSTLTDPTSGNSITDVELESDLEQIIGQYQQATSAESRNPASTVNQGIFYLEKQLEDFIIHNWASTELGKRYDLIIEDGELRSQQYRTDIGPIDILVRDKKTGSYVVIELKKDQTSDRTIGQIARYMGWVEEKFSDSGVTGIIIAKGYDKKLEYALKRMSDIDVYIYEVNFRLKEFKS